MANRLTSVLGYIGASLVLVAALLVPFLLMGKISEAVAGSGVKVDGVYSGGDVRRTISKHGYQIAIYRPVLPRLLQSTEPFVQLAWGPVNALPGEVHDEVDIDGDGIDDVRVDFRVPADPKAALSVDVVPLNDQYRTLRGEHAASFSRLIVRTDQAILVRVPLREASSPR